MKKNIFLSASFLFAATCFSAGLAHAAEEDVTNKDPARWYKADETPKARNQNFIKEANAAYAQALQECKDSKGAEAKACRLEAKDNLNRDKARAKRILESSS
ncbi:hypothetical protein PQR62_03025 [Herbaspirillum lusitanum]|uniref:DUF4398 domain-containing protein n=1 Tax=Herbaspirillum lusitanum TaxID=213312 RepID=A0ABW9A2W1_9BURK